jgi:serine/threonine protein kinase
MILHVLLGVAQGMEWLPAHGILHGDLKAANCLPTVLPEDQACEPDNRNAESALLQAPDSGGCAAGTAAAAAAAGGAASYKLVPKVTDFGLSR